MGNELPEAELLSPSENSKSRRKKTDSVVNTKIMHFLHNAMLFIKQSLIQTFICRIVVFNFVQ